MTLSQKDAYNNAPGLVSNPVEEKKLVPESTPPNEPANPPASTQKPWQKIPKPLGIIGAIALLGGVSYGAYQLFFSPSQADSIFLSGRIEGYETDIAAKIGGKIASVTVREGDSVVPGQLLVQIDDTELQAQLQGAIARVRAAQEQWQRTRQQLPILQAQLKQAKLTTQQASQESQGKVLEIQNAVASARAQLVEAQQNLTLAQTKQRRTNFLYQQGAVSAQQRDEDNTALNTTKARVAAAEQEVQSALGRLKQAQATQQNPPIRAAAELQIEKQIAQAQTDIAVAQQEVRDAQATQAQTQANLNYLVIKSPLTARVITRLIEPGEVVAAGAPLLSLVDEEQLYLRGFVPEKEIGQVKVGQTARVYLDSFPEQPLQATVSRIDPKASFTPENTYFKEDRVTQAFGVELTLTNPQGLAKPGMPADGRILLPESNAKTTTLLPPILNILGQTSWVKYSNLNILQQ